MEKSKKEALKTEVHRTYAAIAQEGSVECCEGSSSDATCFADSYEGKAGYFPEADLKLGCGMPTEFININPGDTVVDLGSGAGNDCFVAQERTGPEGRVIGLDFTFEMVRKARENARKLGVKNVSFALGEIEDNPLPNDFADVVISNCVFNLIPDKVLAFKETFRIIKVGGHMSFSDVIIDDELPDAIRSNMELFTGCVAGAHSKEAYLRLITDVGFEDVQILSEKSLPIPEALIEKHVSVEEISRWRDAGNGLKSITISARKSSTKADACCESSCCA
ncbi:MAG: arsenite methyltransferase [Saprospiraceae bacterium]|nr:arsenite methyltransferase [Saprospiraceae bacterium]